MSKCQSPHHATGSLLLYLLPWSDIKTDQGTIQKAYTILVLESIQNMSAPTIVHLRDIQPRPSIFTIWEKYRHSKAHPLVECFAEFLGVFFYVYCGVGSTATFVIGSILNEAGLSSILQIGLAYGCGVVLAVSLCVSTSGAHLNPCVSLAFVVFRGFPPMKALRYILAQILGAYVACLIIYVQYHDLIAVAEGALIAANKAEIIFTPQGPAGIFGLYVMPGSNLGRVFLNEFMTDTMLALVIFGCLDPTNILVPPSSVPFVIALAYVAAIWGYALPGLAANSARDLGGRLAAMTIYGTQAAGGTYAAIAALTNIPATLLGAFLYELFLVDSDRVISVGHREFIDAHKNHARNPTGSRDSDSTSEKETTHEIEKA